MAPSSATSNKYIQRLFVAVVFSVLFMSYSFNLWRVADSEIFHDFDKFDEGFVTGRLEIVEKDGLFSHGGFPGFYLDYPDDYKIGIHMNYTQQYADFVAGKPTDGTFEPYKTQPGGQVFIYSIIQKTLPASNLVKMQIYRAINALLAALVFAMLLGWVWRNLGVITSIVASILILLSPALTIFAHNIWWAVWSYFIPMLTMFLVFERRAHGNTRPTIKQVYLILYLSVLVKYFFTGFEFMPPTLVAAICPVIYYCFAEGLSLRASVTRLLVSSLTSLAAVFSGMLLLILQIAMFEGTLGAGVQHIIFSYTKRTSFVYSHMQEQSYCEVIAYYLLEAKYALQLYIPAFEASYLWLIVAALFAAAVCYLSGRKQSAGERLKNTALAIVTAIAILGPLSWIIVFKEHATTHTGFDFIIWQIPFVPLAAILVGRCVQVLCSSRKTVA